MTSRAFLFDINGKASTGAGATVGSAADPIALSGGVRESANQRWVLSGRPAWRRWAAC